MVSYNLGQFLSPFGKEIFCKVMAYAMPNYVVQCFPLLIEYCQDIERAMQCLWQVLLRILRIHIGSLGRNFVVKDLMEGQGSKMFELLNLTMLAKQCWRLIKFPNSLTTQVFKKGFIDQPIGSINREGFDRLRIDHGKNDKHCQINPKRDSVN